ncbi:MAG: winged helix-turn-helix transcriptional regulator, partial [Planctomycetota bacterium]
MTQLPVEYPRPIDQEVLDLLRHSPGMTIQELTAQLGVTATAVRQRLERLERSGCVAREKEIAGRGRPVYRYRVTPLGGRFAGVSYAELATAMWNEILEIEDAELRDHLIGRIAHRLGRSLR